MVDLDKKLEGALIAMFGIRILEGGEVPQRHIERLKAIFIAYGWKAGEPYPEKARRLV